MAGKDVHGTPAKAKRPREERKVGSHCVSVEEVCGACLSGWVHRAEEAEHPLPWLWI